MKQRCKPNFKVIRPTYEGCSYAEEWKDFQLFAAWCDDNYMEGYQLDKDTKVLGNKIYSPDTCVFLPVTLNSYVASLSMADDKAPLGIYYKERDKKYYSQGHDVLTSKRKHLGCFKDPQIAYDKFVEYKLIRLEYNLAQYKEVDSKIKENIRLMTHNKLKSSAEKHGLNFS